VTAQTDAALTGFDAAGAGRGLAVFIDDLANWYVRCSRSRFSSAGAASQEDAHAAFATLHTCLTTLAGLLAPITPFLADELHENLVRSVAPHTPDSVHLTAFPQPDETARDEDLCAAMALARRLVTLGRDARVAAGVPVRQPLRRASVTLPAEARNLLPTVREVIAAELNVRTVDLDGWAVARSLNPNFRTLGPYFGGRTKAVATAIACADADKAIARLRELGLFTVDVNGEDTPLREEHVRILETPLPGWQVFADGPYGVALDLEIDEELRVEGLAREFVRLVNDVRKACGLRLDERITLTVSPVDDNAGEVATMLAAHGDTIARDVLGDAITWSDSSPAGAPAEAAADQLTIGSSRVRITLLRQSAPEPLT
jgi:isoleucyl-tRNA synthetase